MAMDTIARGMASQVRSLLAGTALSRKKVTLLILGQSTEQGPVLLGDKAAYPAAFTSARNAGFMPRRLIPAAGRGGWWAKVYDQLWDWGYDLDIAIGAVGGASLLADIVGTVNARSNSFPYYQKRTDNNYPDHGDFGNIVQFGSKTFACTTGRKRQAFNAAPHPGVVGTSNIQDFVAFSQTSEASAGSAPDVSSTTVGQTVVDGTVTWTMLNGALYASEGSFIPGNDGSLPNSNWSGNLGEGSVGRGFDPLGIIQAAYQLGLQGQGEERIVWFSQGQSDLGATSTSYQRCVMMLANFFLRRGWKVLLGNTIWSGASTGATTTNYGLHVTGIDNAVTDLSAIYPGQVFRGANLYSVLGTTGNMAAKRFTGAITGGNLLTVTAELSGSQFEVGQRVFNGTALVGTIASFGTGAGGTGTYNLTGGVNTASTTLISVGDWMQYDGVHFNGKCVVESDGAAAIADSIKTILPQRRVIL